MREYVDGFIQYMRAQRGASDHTLRAYSKDLGLFFQHMEESGAEDVEVSEPIHQ